MNPEMFREYDIRGIVGKDMDENDAVLIGKGIGTYLKQNGKTDLTVGRDCRASSDLYSDKLIEGLLSTGCNIINVGTCSTPLLYFSIRHLGKDGGIMVTASHNPPEYNGFKICSGYDTIHGKEIQKILRIIKDRTFLQGNGKAEPYDIVTPYRKFVRENVTISRPLRVGVDAGNGTGGAIAVPLLKSLGCEVFDIYCDMDGTFPNHEPDPTVLENMKDLISLVKSEKLDVGIGFDGDGDRIGVIDENGDIVFGDQLMIIFSREILSRKPGAKFISEVKCSKTMYDDIEMHGGIPIMWKTGHSLIKDKMKQEKATLAGEMSGHIFFADRYFGYDDAIYASLRLLEIIKKAGEPYSTKALLKDAPEMTSTPEIRFDCPDEVKFPIVEKAKDAFRKYPAVTIDGIRIKFDDGWALIRASNTQPALVLRFEAKDENKLAEIRSFVEAGLNKIIEEHGKN